MRMTRTLDSLLLMLFITAMVAGGCASTRDITGLDMPEIKPAAAANGKTVFIRSVRDARVFEESPRDPSIPSLKGGLRNNTENIRQRAIARKRDSDGDVSGDVILPEDDTVAIMVEKLLRNALISLGYVVADDANTRDAIILDVTIDRFWSWMLLDTWLDKYGVEIETVVSVQSAKGQYQLPISIYSAQRGWAFTTTGIWRSVYAEAMDKYIENARTVLGSKLR